MGRKQTQDTSRQRFVTSKVSEVTDPQTPDLLREAGRQSKAQHNFLTLLAHNRVNTGWHTVLNRITQTRQDHVLKESERGKRPLKTRLATSQSRRESGR